MFSLVKPISILSPSVVYVGDRDVQILQFLGPGAIFKSEYADMVTAYDVQTYLLDKSNIQDTVTRMVRLVSIIP